MHIKFILYTFYTPHSSCTDSAYENSDECAVLNFDSKYAENDVISAITNLFHALISLSTPPIPFLAQIDQPFLFLTLSDEMFLNDIFAGKSPLSENHG